GIIAMFEGRKTRRLIDAVLQVGESTPIHECDRNFVGPLVRIGAPAVGPLIDAFDAATNSIQEGTIFRSLLGLGATAVPQLVAALNHRSEKIRFGVVHVLRFMESEAAILPLIEVARGDRSARIRIEAVHALGSGIVTQNAFDALVALVKDRNEDVAGTAISSLWLIMYLFASRSRELGRSIKGLPGGILDWGRTGLQAQAVKALAGFEALTNTDTGVDRASLFNHRNPTVRLEVLRTWRFPSGVTRDDVIA